MSVELKTDQTIRSNRRLRVLSIVLGVLSIVLLGVLLEGITFWPTSTDPVDPPVKVFELNLTEFHFPKELDNDKANFRFIVDLRFTNEEGQFTTEQAVMPGLDTFWECHLGRDQNPNYVRGDDVTLDGESYGQFNMETINQWDPLILLVKGKSVHSIRFEVFDVKRKNAWDTLVDTLKEILKNTIGAAIGEMKGEIPEKMPLSLSESLGGAADELEFFLLKKLANAKAEDLLFRGSTKLEGLNGEDPRLVQGRGTKGTYKIGFSLTQRAEE